MEHKIKIGLSLRWVLGVRFSRFSRLGYPKSHRVFWVTAQMSRPWDERRHDQQLVGSSSSSASSYIRLMTVDIRNFYQRNYVICQKHANIYEKRPLCVRKVNATNKKYFK